MAQGVKRIVAVPVLAGFALSLMVLATLVGSVRADAACDSCRVQSFYRSQQPGGPCYGYTSQYMFVCLNNQAKIDCTDRGICPGADSSSVSCTGTFTKNECKNKATGICDNGSWAKYCQSNTHTCQDSQTYPNAISPCNVSCECNPLP